MGRSHVPCKYFRPAPQLAEQDPHAWWRAGIAAVRSALSSMSVPDHVEAIAVSSMNALVLVDANGRSVRPAIMQLDRRAAADAAFLEAELGAEICRVTGNAVAEVGYWLPLLHWLNRNERESLARTSAFMYPNGYFSMRLSGVPSIDRTRAATTLLFDRDRQTWEEQLLDVVGLRGNQLPAVFSPTEVIGTLRPKAARLLGLRSGIPVVAGAMDSVAAALGLGLARRADCAVMFGTVARVGLLSADGTAGPSEPAADIARPAERTAAPRSGIVDCPFPVPGLRWSMSALWGAGTSLQWIADVFHGGKWERVRLPSQPSDLGDLFFSAPTEGESGMAAGVDMGHGSFELSAAGVIGVLAELVERLEEVERSRSCPARRIRVCGRGAHLFAPAVAALLQRPVDAPDEPETDTRGGAVLASTGAGLFADVGVAAAALSGPQARSQPVGDWSAYRTKWRRWCQAKATKSFTHERSGTMTISNQGAQPVKTSSEARPRDPLRLARYSLPTAIVYGAGALEQLPSLLSELGLAYPLLVTDRGLATTGIPGRVGAVLSSAGIKYELFAGVEPDPTTAVADEIGRLLRERGHDSVIGLGGGSPMDAAKAGAAVAASGLPVLDLVGPDKVPCEPLPIIAIPSTAGTGSEVTRFAVLTNVEAGAKASIASMRIMPKFALLDPYLTTGLPRPLTASTGMDALAHAVESYGSVWNNPVSEGMALHAISLVGQHLRAAASGPDDLVARGGMLAASCIAELAANTTRLGLAHALAVPLGATHHVPHGVGVAMMLAPMCAFNEEADGARYERMRVAIGTGEGSMSGAVTALRRDLGLEDRLRDFGVKKEDYERIVALALKSDNVLANPRPVGADELMELLAELQ